MAASKDQVLTGFLTGAVAVGDRLNAIKST